MNAAKTFYTEERKPFIVELSYADYSFMAQAAKEAAQLKEKIEATHQSLTSAYKFSTDKIKVPPGTKAARTFDTKLPPERLPPTTTTTLPEPPETTPPKATTQISPTKPNTEKISAAPKTEHPASPATGTKETKAGIALALPQAVIRYLKAQDEEGTLTKIFSWHYRTLGERCGGALSATFQERHICLWNYDEWEMFAFFDISDGHLRLSVEESLMPNTPEQDIWIPPKWMSPKKLARTNLNEASENIVEILINAFKS